MKAVIVERKVLEGLDSASGLERIGEQFYIVGDSSTDLYRLDKALNLVGKTHLYDPVTVDPTPGAKKLKRDLEVVKKVEVKGGRKELWCFGSGSKSPLRDVVYRIDISDPSNPKKVGDVSIVSLYNAFRAIPDVVGGEKLNIEGATVLGDSFLLFQRGNLSGINPILKMPFDQFLAYVDDPEHKPVPSIEVMKIQLPSLWDNPAGFSDALTWNGMIVFSASVEVKNPDGARHASFIGLIRDEKVLWCVEVKDNQGEVARLKIEGINVLEAKVDGNGWYFLLKAVTDPDGGASEAITIEVKKNA